MNPGLQGSIFLPTSTSRDFAIPFPTQQNGLSHVSILSKFILIIERGQLQHCAIFNMRLFPPPWEGTHPAFPKTPERYQESDIFDWLPEASVGGLLVGTVARIFSTSGGAYTLAATGGLALLGLGIGGLSEGMNPLLAKSEIYPLLEDEGIEIPKHKLFTRTKEWTGDDSNVVGALAGLSTFAIMRRPLPGAGSKILRALGAACFGTTVGSMLHSTFITSRNSAQQHQWLMHQVIAKHIYESKTRQAAPHWLYPLATDKEELDKQNESMSAAIAAYLAKAGFKSAANAQELFAPHAGRTDGRGQPIFLRERNYAWKYDDQVEGLRYLNSHLEYLRTKRRQLVEVVEFLWIEVAKRERLYLKENDRDSENGRLLRKSLELLSSTHGDYCHDISVYDWLVNDTQKMILQVQNGGDWLPQKPQNIDLKIYRPPEGLLEGFRNHKAALEKRLAEAESAVVDVEHQDKLNDMLRHTRENIKATEMVIGEVEKRRHDPSSVSDAE
jgi:hypothetical protein